jgi:FkbM family methyltransferase
MNDLMAALKLRSFEPLLKAYKAAGIDLRDAIDGGAGSGKTANEMLAHLSSSATIHAFEPFPGNHRFFADADPRTRLIPKALAETSKQMSFLVTSTVASDSAWGRRGMTGYSSVGKLVEEVAQTGTTLVVDCTRADAVVPADGRVGFIKLDLQGGELNALKGCTKLLRGVALMWVEYSGQPGLMDFLHEHDFMLFDTEYLFTGVPSAEARKLFDVSRENAILSTNRKAWFGFRKAPWRDYEADLFRHKKAIGLIQTDLVCVNKHHLAKFTAAVSRI